MKQLNGFSYYGGKMAMINRYPHPKHKTIVEPFAGGAAYSFNWYKHNIVLCEINKDVYDMLCFLRDSDLNFLKNIPRNVCAGWKISDIVSDINGCPNGLMWILRSAANVGTCGRGTKINTITKIGAVHWHRNTIKKIQHWHGKIKHWQIYNKSYEFLNVKKSATYFIDPPYNNLAGSRYANSEIDYTKLVGWIKNLNGQIIVCENEGANWMNFKTMKKNTPGVSHANNTRCKESICLINQ